MIYAKKNVHKKKKKLVHTKKKTEKQELKEVVFVKNVET
jgi:hypothetical protein